MISGLPAWLLERYSALTLQFGRLGFTLGEAREVLGDTPRVAVVLHRLKERGWADSWERSEYRLIHPLARFSMTSSPWREQVKQADRLPVLELAVASLLGGLGRGLKSIVLFGSLSRGEAKPESDVDLLVVASGLPERYGERTKVLNAILASREADAWRTRLWNERRIYPLVDVLALTPEEAQETQPFFLDMVKHRVTILDRERIVERKLERLGEMLSELGGREVLLSDGGGYWIIPRGEKGREVEL